MLLIIAAGIQRNTWFLLGTGALGTMENVLVAGSPRRPEAFGVPLTFAQVIGEVKVMDTLFAVEKSYPRVGLVMLETFFPGRLLSFLCPLLRRTGHQCWCHWVHRTESQIYQPLFGIMAGPFWRTNNMVI